jgi:hypothetical protein
MDSQKQIIGQYNNIIVYHKTHEGYKCKCLLCDKLFYYKKLYKIKSGHTKSCGCLKNKNAYLSSRVWKKKIFGNWRVLERVEKPENLSKDADYWKCVCGCGVIEIILGNNLLRGLSTNCAICRAKNQIIDIRGQTFHRLTAIKYIEERNGNPYYEFLCKCGKTIITQKNSVTSGKIKSCGCYLIDLKKTMIGEKHPSWKKDKTDEERERGRCNNEYWNFLNTFTKTNREKQFCVLCGSKKKLRIHHKYSYCEYKEYRYDVEKCVYLCHQCHKDFHINFMGGNSKICTEEDLERYMDEKKLTKGS